MAGDRKLRRSARDARRHRAPFDHACSSAVSARHDEDCFPREDLEEPTVFDLVYKYLGECADKDMKSRQRNCACNKFNKRHARRRDIRGRDVAAIGTNPEVGILGERSRSHPDENAPFERVHRSSSREYVADYARAVRDELANHSYSILQRNDFDWPVTSLIAPGAINPGPFENAIIYIERRRAKFYVREALLYGLQSGLLIPADRRRNILRVSRKLGNIVVEKHGERR